MKRKISALKITRIRLSFDVKTLANMPAVYIKIFVVASMSHRIIIKQVNEKASWLLMLVLMTASVNSTVL